ncbi:unnamed protein product, partial [Effrenium voratum]
TYLFSSLAWPRPHMSCLDLCCLASLPQLLGTLQLAHLAPASSALGRAVGQELQRRVRQLLHPAWGDDAGSSSGKSSKPQDIHTLAARYAGGWSALLAGREWLLDTSLPKAPRRSSGTAAAVRNSLLLWDIMREGDAAPLWSGVLPLAPFLRQSFAEDSDGETVPCTYLYPQSSHLPGCEHQFRHARSRRPKFQISASTEDQRNWWHRLSLLGPNCAETQIGKVGFIPNRFSQHGASPIDPSLPEPQEIVRAVDGVGEPVPGEEPLGAQVFLHFAPLD